MATETFPFRIQEPDGLRVVVQGIEYSLGTTTTVSVLSARLSDAEAWQIALYSGVGWPPQMRRSLLS